MSAITPTNGTGRKKMGDLNRGGSKLPWRVTLFVRPSLLAVDLVPVVYYVRGAVDEVGSKAYLLWRKWEKIDKGLGEQEYPDVEENGIVESVDNNDFYSAYKELIKHKLPYIVAGDRGNPSAFTCLGRTDI